mmetsp:Transcript_2180/g.14430  ORF Transcript_2180/g.14430 Transcript_2180/m.14430 type:complete len:398 (-) Transcript_2180:142-1335(-)
MLAHAARMRGVLAPHGPHTSRRLSSHPLRLPSFPWRMPGLRTVLPLLPPSRTVRRCARRRLRGFPTPTHRGLRWHLPTPIGVGPAGPPDPSLVDSSLASFPVATGSSWVRARLPAPQMLHPALHVHVWAVARRRPRSHAAPKPLRRCHRWRVGLAWQRFLLPRDAAWPVRIGRVHTTRGFATVRPRRTPRRRRSTRRPTASPRASSALGRTSSTLRPPKRTAVRLVRPAARAHGKQASLALRDVRRVRSPALLPPLRRSFRLASTPRARLWPPRGAARGSTGGRTATCAAREAIPQDVRPPSAPVHDHATPHLSLAVPAASSVPAASPAIRRTRDVRGGSSRRLWPRLDASKTTRRPKASEIRACNPTALLRRRRWARPRPPRAWADGTRPEARRRA